MTNVFIDVRVCFNRNGEVVSVEMYITGELFESFTEEQIKRLYSAIKEVKVPLAEFYDFSADEPYAKVYDFLLCKLDEIEVDNTEWLLDVLKRKRQ